MNIGSCHPPPPSYSRTVLYFFPPPSLRSRNVTPFLPQPSSALPLFVFPFSRVFVTVCFPSPLRPSFSHCDTPPHSMKRGRKHQPGVKARHQSEFPPDPPTVAQKKVQSKKLAKEKGEIGKLSVTLFLLFFLLFLRVSKLFSPLCSIIRTTRRWLGRADRRESSGKLRRRHFKGKSPPPPPLHPLLQSQMGRGEDRGVGIRLPACLPAAFNAK